jgi:hypothetical protein
LIHVHSDVKHFGVSRETLRLSVTLGALKSVDYQRCMIDQFLLLQLIDIVGVVGSFSPKKRRMDLSLTGERIFYRGLFKWNPFMFRL